MKNETPLSLGCVILASGNSARFGKNKLLVPVQGKPMIERAFEAVPAQALSDVVVITQYEDIEALAGRFGFRCVRNRSPELGLSHSVRLGTLALRECCDGILYQVADQPWLKRESVSRMLEVFRAHPGSIVSMSCGGRRGNPCVFPKTCFDELCRLTGDRGGRAVIEGNGHPLILFEAAGAELADIDTPEDLIQSHN